MFQTVDYILFSSLMEVGCNCMKHCSNGEYHSTILKLKTFSDILKNSISWQRKKGAFKSREGSILISTIQDVVPDGPRKCILTNNKRYGKCCESPCLDLINSSFTRKKSNKPLSLD